MSVPGTQGPILIVEDELLQALAMEHEAPDRADAIVRRAQELLQYSDSAQRVAVLERERGAKAAVAQELAQRDATIRELQARLEAQERAPGADAMLALSPAVINRLINEPCPHPEARNVDSPAAERIARGLPPD